MVKFSREAVESMLAEGDAVTVTVSGTAGNVGFSGTAVIRVIRRGKDGGQKKKPALFQAAEYAGSAPAGPTGAMEIFYAHPDHLGTPRAMTDANGNVVWKADYRPFGEAEVVIGDVGNEIRFPGQYFDSESGLHYNYHRYYDPSTGRYLTPDPIGLAGGINLFAYVENNPINWTDPRGLKRFESLPPSCCEYYKKRCDEGNECEDKKDEYACKAYDCCQTFGDNPAGNCTRGCLIAFDKRNCAHLSGEARKRCRRIAHHNCYDRCNFHLEGIKGKVFGPPPECVDAMEEVGGMDLFDF